MKKYFLLLSIVLCVISSCDEDKSSGTPVYVSTDISGITSVYCNTFKKINVQANSIDSELARFQIKSFDRIRGDILLKDSLIDGYDFSYDYLYNAPMLTEDSTIVKLTFSVTDTKGFTQNLVREIMIIQNDYLLEEVAGVTMYSSEYNDHPNGFCLESMRPIVVSLADSASIDFYAYQDNDDLEVLSREWKSNTNVYFARANSFDYANASWHSVTETYKSVVTYPQINMIEKDDIIFIGREKQVIGVIKVVQMYDEEGVINDRYIFNIKKIRTTF